RDPPGEIEKILEYGLMDGRKNSIQLLKGTQWISLMVLAFSFPAIAATEAPKIAGDSFVDSILRGQTDLSSEQSLEKSEESLKEMDAQFISLVQQGIVFNEVFQDFKNEGQGLELLPEDQLVAYVTKANTFHNFVKTA